MLAKFASQYEPAFLRRLLEQIYDTAPIEPDIADDDIRRELGL